MFWQFRNGSLMNLNALEEISLFHDAETGLCHVRGRIFNRPQSYVDLFSSEKVEDAERVLKNLGNSLEHQESLVREVYATIP